MGMVHMGWLGAHGNGQGLDSRLGAWGGSRGELGYWEVAGGGMEWQQHKGHCLGLYLGLCRGRFVG